MSRYNINNTDISNLYEHRNKWPSYMTTKISLSNHSQYYKGMPNFVNGLSNNVYGTSKTMSGYTYDNKSLILYEKNSIVIPALLDNKNYIDEYDLKPFKVKETITATTYMQYKNNAIYMGSSSTSINTRLTNRDGLFIMLVGGGGGGGGSACSHKDVWIGNAYMFCGGCGGGAGSCLMVYINFKNIHNKYENAYIELSPGKGGEGGSSQSNSGMNVSTITGIKGTEGEMSSIRIYGAPNTSEGNVLVSAEAGTGGKGGVANGGSDDITLNNNSSGGYGKLNTTKIDPKYTRFVQIVLNVQGGIGGYSNPYWTKNSKQYDYDLRGTTNSDKIELNFPLNTSYKFPSFSKNYYELGFNESYVSPFNQGRSSTNNYLSASGGFNICNSAYYYSGSVTSKMGLGYGGDGGNDGAGRKGNYGGFYIIADIDD